MITCNIGMVYIVTVGKKVRLLDTVLGVVITCNIGMVYIVTIGKRVRLLDTVLGVVLTSHFDDVV